MIESKSEIEHRTQEQSLCSTVSPVAPGATNRTQPSKARFPLVKFSSDANISCVIQETKIFHQGLPPSTGSCKEEILFRCENFLCYARNENISPRPPLNWKI